MSWFYWALGSAFFAALTAIFGKVGVEGISSLWATAIRTTVILVFTWGLALVAAKPVVVSEVSGKTWIFLVLSGLATGLSWICYFRALQLGQAAQVAPVDKLSVVLVIVFAAICLHENLTWHHWVGCGLIAGGAALLATKG